MVNQSKCITCAHMNANIRYIDSGSVCQHCVHYNDKQIWLPPSQGLAITIFLVELYYVYCRTKSNHS